MFRAADAAGIFACIGRDQFLEGLTDTVFYFVFCLLTFPEMQANEHIAFYS